MLGKSGCGVAKSVRVLFIHRDLVHYGGVPRLFSYYAWRHDRSRVSLQIASFVPPSKEMRRVFESVGVPVYTLGDCGYVLPVLKLRALLRHRTIDVVAAASFKAYIVAKVASIGTQTRVIFWLHGVHLMGGMKERLYRRLAKGDTLVFISQAVRRRYEYLGHLGRRFVVYNGVSDPYTDTDEKLFPYPRNSRARYGIPQNAVVLGYVASFVELKDHKTLLLAFARLAQKYSNLHLVLIGTGPLLPSVRKLAEAIQGGERIHFLGAREDARQLLGIMDIYVHPAVGEGFGLAVVEAMLAKLPVVVANAGALPEIVRHGETGFLFDPGDACDLMKMIDCLIEDPHLRKKLGEKGRAYCLENFSLAGFSERLTRILEGEVLM